MSKNKARDAAYHILQQYFETGRPLGFFIDNLLDPGMLQVDKNLAYNMVKGTVRNWMLLDYGLSRVSDREIKKLDLNVAAILRLGLYQLFFLEKVPSYSIVDESVKLARRYVHVGASKFVNAVLRKAANWKNPIQYLYLLIDQEKAGLEYKLSLKYSFPLWLVEYWFQSYGTATAEKIMQSLNQNPDTFIRFNSVLTRAQVIEKLSLREPRDSVEKQMPPELASINFRVMTLGQIVESQLFREGYLTVQDLSSQIAVKYFLNPKPGEKILDLCAAPGGKSIFASELMKQDGSIVAIDINQAKLAKMEENIERLKLENITLVRDDATKLDSLGTQVFDKVFVDAPCSAWGTISKNPDAKYARDYAEIRRLAQNSYKILSKAAQHVEPGGEVIFYTCTLSPIENQQTINKFLAAFPEYYIPPDLPLSMANLTVDAGVEIMPYYFNSEGGFVCRMVKR